MHGLDFLSGAPKTLIFEKGSNKTNFGGVLTIIYLLIVLIIIIAYMVDYAINPKYSIVYTYEHQFKADKKSKDDRTNNKDLNPKVTFNIKMSSEHNESHFGVLSVNPKDGERYRIDFGKDYTANLYDLYFEVYYICNRSVFSTEHICELNDQEKEYNKFINAYQMTLNYSGQKVDHQNSESPLKNEFIQEDFVFNINDRMTVTMLRWKTIKYTEERGMAGLFDNLFGISNEFYGGSLMDPINFNIEVSELFKKFETEGLKILSYISMDKETSNNYFDNYSRTKKGIFDPISSICSLALTVYNGFIFVFCGYYSNNFDNYKIVERVLSKSKKKPMKMKDINEKNDNIEISEDLDKKDALLSSNSDNNEENKIDNEKDKEQNSNNDINDKEEERILPRLHFYDFLFNNFYSKKYCPSIKHDLLVTCNEIVSKYNSIDYILYNQIKLENLLKDYKWNNPKLNDIQNNELMKELNLLS